MRNMTVIFMLTAMMGVTACQQRGGSDERVSSFDAIGSQELISFIGTEPFWGGTVQGASLRYDTPENPDGTVINVQRFAGNNGLGFSGESDGRSFDLTITPGQCSDGMSDRDYPFVATLQFGDEQRNGCAWTDNRSFTGPKEP